MLDDYGGAAVVGGREFAQRLPVAKLQFTVGLSPFQSTKVFPLSIGVLTFRWSWPIEYPGGRPLLKLDVLSMMQGLRSVRGGR